MNRILAGLIAIFVLLFAQAASAQQNNLYWLNYSGAAPWPPAAWTPASPNNPLPVTCISGCSGGGGGGGTSYQDEAEFTLGTSDYNPTGGIYTSSQPTALTNGQGGVQRINAYRAGIVDVDTTNNNLYSALTSALPIQKNGSPAAATGQTPGTAQTGTQVNQDVGLQAVGNTSIASCVSNYGTGPGSVSCPGVNAALSLVALTHPATTGLANNLNAKASAGNLTAFNCTGITGGAAGYCIAYNGSTTPITGALTGANVLDFCYFDTTARGCSLSHLFPGAVAYNSGIQILVSSASSPYTYTTGTDTAAISADLQ